MTTYKPDVSIESTPLWADIREIFSAKKSVSKWVFKAIIHTEKADIPVRQIIQWPENRDYYLNIGTSSHIYFDMGLGDYKYFLYPFREHLEVSIKSIPLDDKGAELTDGVVVQRYKALFPPEKNPVVTAGKDALHDAKSLNMSQMVDVVLELQERALEPLRRKMTSDTFRGVTVERVIRAVLFNESQKLLIDGKPAADGIELDTPDNTEEQSDILIPDGTLISNFPTWCQEKGCGVYATSIGTFFQRFNDKNLWFVYPIYRFNKFDTAKKKLVIFNIPQGRYDGADKSYKVEGDVVKIVSSNGSNIKDEAGNSELNKGFGFRMVNAKAIMSKPVDIENGVATFNRAQTVTEVGHKARKDELQYAPVVKPSANNFHEYSKIFPSHSIHLQCQWENADPKYLFPGMAVKYIYFSHGKYVELKGCLTGVFINRSLQGRNGTGTIYTTHITLGLTLESKEETYELPPSAPTPASF